MNTPNKLTVGRMIATPIFMATMLINFPYHYAVSLVLFIVASLTDMIDGKMARKYNLVTDFGKFMDPLADKMLTTSAYLGFMFIYGGTKFSWHIVVITFIVLFREFAVTSVRLVAATKGTVVAANMWGKAKTVSQMVAIIVTLLLLIILQISGNSSLWFVFGIIINVVVWISVILTVISGVVYLKDNADLYKTAK